MRLSILDRREIVFTSSLDRRRLELEDVSFIQGVGDEMIPLNLSMIVDVKGGTAETFERDECRSLTATIM